MIKCSLMDSKSWEVESRTTAVPVMIVREEGDVVHNHLEEMLLRISTPLKDGPGKKMFTFQFPNITIPEHESLQEVLRGTSVTMNTSDFFLTFNKIRARYEEYTGKRLLCFITSANLPVFMDIRESLVNPNLVLSCNLESHEARFEFSLNGVLQILHNDIETTWAKEFRVNAYQALKWKMNTKFPEPTTDKVPLPEVRIFFVPPWASILNFKQDFNPESSKVCKGVFVPFVSPCVGHSIERAESIWCYRVPYVKITKLYKYIAARLHVNPDEILIVNEWMQPLRKIKDERVYVTGVYHVFSTLPLQGGLLDTLEWAKREFIDANKEILSYEPAKQLILQLKYTIEGFHLHLPLLPNGFFVPFIPKTGAELENLGIVEFTLAAIARMQGRLPSKKSIRLATKYGTSQVPLKHYVGEGEVGGGGGSGAAAAAGAGSGGASASASAGPGEGGASGGPGGGSGAVSREVVLRRGFIDHVAAPFTDDEWYGRGGGGGGARRKRVSHLATKQQWAERVQRKQRAQRAK